MLHRPLLLALCLFFNSFIAVSGRAGDRPMPQVEEELILISSPIPVLAYIFRPRIEGPLPLVVMNHGESLDATERSFFPLVEFRDAAFWFARRGNLVVVPIRPGFSRTAIELPERGLFGLYFGEVGKCSAPNFRDPGIAIAVIDQWVIDHMIGQNEVLPKGVIVVGQSGGGWGALALSSLKSRLDPGHHHLCGWPRRPRRWQAQQQLRAGPAGGGRRAIRQHSHDSGAVHLRAERLLLRTGLVEADAGCLSGCGR